MYLLKTLFICFLLKQKTKKVWSKISQGTLVACTMLKFYCSSKDSVHNAMGNLPEGISKLKNLCEFIDRFHPDFNKI